MKSKNLIWGLFFIAAAAVVILNQTGALGNIGIWTMLISLALVPVIITSVANANFPGIMFSLAIYAILFAKPLGIEKFTPWPVIVTAAFLSIGLTMIFPNKHLKDHHSGRNSSDNWPTDSTDGENIKITTKYSGSVKYITSQNLKTADIECSFAGLKVYLDNAKLADGQAIINVYASFGGVELYIPKEWKVINDVSCTFGGAEEKGLKGAENGENTLILKGIVKFSGVSIFRV